MSAKSNKIKIGEEFMVMWREEQPPVFCKKGVLRNFAKFTGKQLCESLAIFLRTAFLKEHLRATASKV